MRMVPFMHIHRRLACLHHAAGAVRWLSSCRQAPLLTVAPARAIIDEQISIKGHFLPSYLPVTVCAQMHSEEGDLWEAFAHYQTKADGTVNLARDHSLGGSYLGCEPMGLFWGLQPAHGSREGLRLRKRNVEMPYVVHISLLEGHVSTSEGQSSELAAVTAERWYMAPGIRRIEIRQNGVVGTLFLPPGPGPFPAMLDLWGMTGGLIEYRSALFASRGFASFSIAYLGHKDLPGSAKTLNVGLSYFKAAFNVLKDHPQICADSIGIIGLSFGCYLAMQTATQPDVKPACLICVNGPMGTNIYMGETRVTVDEKPKYWNLDGRGYVTFKDLSLPKNFAPQNKAKMENLDCPLLFILGEDDQSSASVENADEIEEILKAAGKSQLFTRLSYPAAGHLIEPPYSPNSRIALWRVQPQKLFILWGGHLAPHAAAQEDSWKKIQDFMNTHLRR
ncbi:bile acid-CoA:amino acid N-acyltransferase-like [Genypterus blacodes]|uniref:bile acid-CoA:amino acid N-acyltransferase-like n=1 Tax=Genypterus blacodes TaxID=154954 RepID=UPI003F7631E7